MVEKVNSGEWRTTLSTHFCRQPGIDMSKKFFELNKPDVVLFSAMWTRGDPDIHGSFNSQSAAAKGGSVYLVAANTTGEPGYGGGVYAPDGSALAQVKSSQPSVVIADLPLK